MRAPTHFTNRLALSISLLFLTAILLQCTGKVQTTDPLVYAHNQAVVYNGSVYYNEAGCASCHGSTYKGDGPEKGTLAVPDLTAALPANKTVLDYFKSITAGKDHHYLGYTDRGRWALAWFSWSLANGIKAEDGVDGNHIRSQAMAQAMQEINDAYKNQRRWFMGMPDPEQNKAVKPMALHAMAVNTVKPVAMPAVTDEIRQQRQPEHPGFLLYESNCSLCHGKYGEGTNTGFKLGLTQMCKERGRMCAAYMPVGALEAIALGSPHQSSGLDLPGFEAFSETDWALIQDYLRGLRKVN
ncbi:MAG: hypothetical protein KDK39_08775 [Leptospiraceae bacterium]|nr:hypothetical protein [Leptospiraceae bacterium]